MKAPMTDDLIERLLRTKSVADHYGNAGTTLVNPDGREAAHALAAKDAEIARLRDALAHYATDENPGGWIAIAALTGEKTDERE